jgi:hypothetical protein
MDFNLTKYDNLNFHNDILTHKRIKALLLWFEYEVYKNNLPLDEQIKFMDIWLNSLLEEEYYEVLPFFESLRAAMVQKTDSLSYNEETNHIEDVIKSHKLIKSRRASLLSKLRLKLIKWYNK